MDLEKIVVTFMGQAAQYHRVVDGVEQRMISLARTAGLTSAAINIPFIAAAGTIGALAYATAQASLEALSLASAYESASVSLEVMTGSAVKGKELLDQITALAVVTPFKTPELLQGAGMLKAFGVETEQIIPIIRMLGEVASGVGIEKLPRIILAFGQVRVAGRLMGQELRQFIDANIPLIEALAKVMNKPVQAIKGMVEEGRVSFADVTAAFKAMTNEGGLFFGLNERKSMSVAGRWSAFVETLQTSMREMGLAFFQEFDVANNLEKITKSIGKMDNARVKEMFKDVHTFLKMIYGLLQTSVYWIEKIVETTRAWGRENEKIVEFVVRVIAQVVFLISTALILYGTWQLIVGLFTLMTSPLGIALITIIAIVAALNALGDMTNFGTGLMKAFEGIFKMFKTAGGALKDALIAEDWDLVGRIIFKALEFAMRSILIALKFELMFMIGVMISRFGVEVERFVKFLVAVSKTVREALLGMGPEDAKKFLDNQLNDSDRILNKKHANQIKMLEEAKQAEIEAAIRPFQQQMNALREQASMSRKMKEDPTGLNDKLAKLEETLAKGVFGYGSEAWMENLKSEFGKRFGFSYDTAEKIGMLKKPSAEIEQFYATFDAKNRMAQVASVHKEFGMVGLERLASYPATKQTGDDKLIQAFTVWKTMLDFAMGVRAPDIPGKPRGSEVAVPMQMNPRAIEMATRIQKEMNEGVWGGQRFDPYNRFNEKLDLLEQGFYGPAGRKGLMGWMLGRPGGPGSIMNEEQYKFGVFEEYTNLRKLIGTPEVNYPKAMYRDTQEAQDLINKSQYESKSVQEEVRDTLRQALEVQQQQRDYQRQVVEEIRRLRGELTGNDGDFAYSGGGDF